MQADDCDINLALSIGGAEFKSNDDHGDRREGEEAGARARKRPPESASRSEDSEATETDHRAIATKKKKKKKKKKLTLSKEQLALLEDSFTEHNILNSKQKHELASQINIQPRQVEVWFQNRRARTKLKQTERDCKSLKKWCEKLREENQKLREEIEELKKMIRSPIHVQMPTTTTLNMCPSCRRRRPAAEFIDKDGFCVKKEQSNWNLYVAG